MKKRMILTNRKMKLVANQAQTLQKKFQTTKQKSTLTKKQTVKQKTTPMIRTQMPIAKIILSPATIRQKTKVAQKIALKT